MGSYQPTPEDKARYAQMRVALLVPVMYHETRFWRSVVNMMAFSWAHGLAIEDIGLTDREVVDWARNNLARAGREGKGQISDQPFTHLLWLDTDHVFNPDMACWLARHDVDAVSALYYGRSGSPLPVAYVKDDSPDEHKHYPLIEVPSALCQVDAVGFGALLMRRDVFERVPEPWFTLDWRAGEDIAFCVKAKKFGIKFYVDGAYKLGHIGEPQIVTEQTYKAHLAANPEKYADKVMVRLGGQDG